MTDKLEAKAVEMLDQLSAKLGTLAQQYGPEVAGVVFEVARWEAVKQTACTLGLFAAAAGAFWLAKKIAPTAEEREKAKDSDGDKEEAAGIYAIVGLVGMIAIGLAVWGAVRLLNIWHLIGIFSPQLYMAARILGLV